MFSNRYFYLYLGLACTFIILFLTHGLTLFKFSISSAYNMYKKMIKALLRTKLAFFDTTPQGRIINRTVKDSDAIDFWFPQWVTMCLWIAGGLAGMLITMCCVAWPSIIVIIPCLIIYFMVFRKFRGITP